MQIVNSILFMKKVVYEIDFNQEFKTRTKQRFNVIENHLRDFSKYNTMCY